jgi:hypothetical protein
MARGKTRIKKVVDWGSGTVVLRRRRKRSEERSAVLVLSSLGLERRKWNKVQTFILPHSLTHPTNTAQKQSSPSVGNEEKSE